MFLHLARISAFGAQSCDVSYRVYKKNVQLVPPEILAILEDPELNATVLLPPEDDLALLSALLNAGTIDRMEAFDILASHVLPLVYTSADLIDEGSGTVETLDEDSELQFMVSGDVITFTLGNSTVSVIEADLPGCAGDSVIHKIDEMLRAELLPDAVAPGGAGATPRGPAVEEDGAAATSMLVPTAVAALAVAGMLL
jgi:Fasciclin domain